MCDFLVSCEISLTKNWINSGAVILKNCKCLHGDGDVISSRLFLQEKKVLVNYEYSLNLNMIHTFTPTGGKEDIKTCTTAKTSYLMRISRCASSRCAAEREVGLFILFFFMYSPVSFAEALT